MGTSIGIDVGGTYIKGVLLKNEEVEKKVSIPSPKGEINAFIDSIIEVASALSQKERLPVGVGIASPYLYDSGEMVTPPNLPFNGRLPIRDLLQERLGRPIVVDNDANVAAFGEWRLGAGRGSRVMLCLTLGTGVGGGVVANGGLFRGAHGMAAEFGHITVDPAGPLCGCGNRGCLETMASATALKRTYCQLTEREGRVANNPTPKEIFTMAKEGDPFAEKAFEMVGESLGIGITSLVNSFDPDTVVIGGGLSNAWSVLWPTVRGEMEKRLLAQKYREVEINPAELGSWGGAVGAACLALES